MYFFRALDQTQTRKHPFFLFTTLTFQFVHSNNDVWRGKKEKKKKNRQKLYMKPIVLNQENLLLKNELKLCLMLLLHMLRHSHSS